MQANLILAGICIIAVLVFLYPGLAQALVIEPALSGGMACDPQKKVAVLPTIAARRAETAA